MALKKVLLLIPLCGLGALGCGGGGGGGAGGKGGAAGNGLAGHGAAGNAGNSGSSGNAGSSGDAGSAGNSGNAGSGQSDAAVDAPTDAPQGYALGGSISGLVGSGLVLKNDSEAILTVAAGATSFAFPTGLPRGDGYEVTVFTQPTSPSQTCTVTNGAGNVGDAGVAGISVTCSTNKFSVGGAVAGFTGTGLVLRDNGGDDLTVEDGATSFTFPTKVASGATFAVTVLTQPGAPDQICTVGGGSGRVDAGDIKSVTINCTAASFTVGGSVTGLAGTVVLQDNGTDKVSVTSNAFAFPTPIASGQPYAVTVLTQPVNPVSQTCTVTSGTGTVTGPVTSAQVNCVTNAFKVRATVNGLTAAGLKLRNGTDVVAVSGSGTVTVSAAAPSGGAYAVSVDTQPSAQRCAVVAPIGTVGASDVTVNVNCGDALYAIRGTISGVVGDVLLQNGADIITVGNGSFSFPTDLATGAAYSVSVATPLSDCTLTNGSGTVASANPMVTIACRSPLAYYYPFDGNAVDHSGNGHDGMVHGATLVADRHGNPQSAYSFDGTDWIEAIGDSLPIGDADRTLTMWLNPSAENAVWGIVYWGQQNCTGDMWGLGYVGSAVFWGGCDDYTSGLTLPTRAWSFVAVRFSGPNHLHMRVNGQAVDQDLANNAMTKASELWIGAQTSTNAAADITGYYYGAIDSVRIYDRALTDAELDMVENLLP